MEKEIASVKRLALDIFENLPDNDKSQFESNKLVLYSGSPKSKIMVVARDLGSEELKHSIPLIGPAGKLFRVVEESLLRQNFIHEPIYTTNTVPFKPRQNIAFTKSIRKKFRPVLLQQIFIVKPIVIISMGLEAFEFLTGVSSSIIKEVCSNNNHYSMADINPRCIVIPCVHPSYMARKGVSVNSISVNEEHRKLFTNLFLKPIYRAVKIAYGE